MGKHESYDKKLFSKQSLLAEFQANMFLLSSVTKAVTFTTLWLHIFAVSHDYNYKRDIHELNTKCF